ncbi:MAG: GGDEF domain-containing protein [Gammaproteobacteria bacterium]
MPLSNGIQNSWIYIYYIILSSILTSVLEVLHSITLHGDIRIINFYIPIVAGIFFGYLLAKNRVLSRTLTEIATIDGLTGIYNRMQFNHLLETEIDRSNRYDGQFSIISMDIDHFKRINDQFGHQTGDKVLIDFCKLVTRCNRSSDIFARYGGEEFIILAQNTSLENTLHHAQRLCSEIAQHQFDKVVHVTCSFGVTEFRNKNDSSTSLLNRADIALYKAKENGRNQVVTS